MRLFNVRTALLQSRITIIICVVIVGCITYGYFALPYSPRHLQQIKAGKLRRNIEEWVMRGKDPNYGYTNADEKCFILSTDFMFGTNSVHAIIRMESSALLDRGYLLGTETEEIYFCGGKSIRLIQ